MHGDFSRYTFRPEKRFAAVLAQQGRLLLDADLNEAAAIQAHLARTFTVDLIGPHAGPADAPGFAIEYRPQADPPDLVIGPGRYYVAGLLCDATPPPRLTPVAEGRPDADDAAAPWTYWTQPDAARDPDEERHHLPPPPFLVYLVVRQRLITAVEDPDLAERALGMTPPDTAARLKTTWQVLPLRPGPGFPVSGDPGPDELRRLFAAWAEGHGRPRPRLAARARRPERVVEDPCLVSPESRYRGENQLYRVEVHQGGRRPTVKWSRENGSVVLPVTGVQGAWVTLAALGRDGRLDLRSGDRVELVDDAYVARGEPAALLQVVEVDVPERRVLLSAEPDPRYGRRPDRHPYLRRWDHRATGEYGGPGLVDGALELVEDTWLDLEDGVQVRFAKGGAYRPGDYWLIPARAATGDVEWPRDAEDRPLLVPPHGPEYGHAPLAWVTGRGAVVDLRHTFAPGAVPVAG